MVAAEAFPPEPTYEFDGLSFEQILLLEVRNEMARRKPDEEMPEGADFYDLLPFDSHREDMDHWLSLWSRSEQGRDSGEPILMAFLVLHHEAALQDPNARQSLEANLVERSEIFGKVLAALGLKVLSGGRLRRTGAR